MKKLIILLLVTLIGLSSCEKEQVHNAVLQEVDGTTLKFGDLKGKWVIINYWASWCNSCIEEIPALNAFYQRYKSQDVVVLGVNYDNVESDELKKIITAQGITYPNLIADPRQALHLGDIPGLPATYIFGPDGKLKEKLFGQQTQESLQQVMKLG